MLVLIVFDFRIKGTTDMLTTRPSFLGHVALTGKLAVAHMGTSPQSGVLTWDQEGHLQTWACLEDTLARWKAGFLLQSFSEWECLGEGGSKCPYEAVV